MKLKELQDMNYEQRTKNREQQIEEMAEDLENTILGLGIHLCEKSAEKLYDLGYRKVSDNYIGTDKVLRSIDYRPVDEVRKETAKDIYDWLEYRFKLYDYVIEKPVKDSIKIICKKYGVEVKE